MHIMLQCFRCCSSSLPLLVQGQESQGPHITTTGCWQHCAGGPATAAATPTCPDACRGLQGQDWLQIRIVGQSFMLHQIRKMVQLATAILRGTAPPECIPLALSPTRDIPIPMAPDVGLFLDSCIFQARPALRCLHSGACRGAQRETSQKLYA